MSRGKYKKHSSGRNQQEFNRLAKAIKSLPNDPTMPQNYLDKTLNQTVIKEDEEEENSPRQKSKSRRFHLYIKENWPNYLLGIILSAFGFLLVTIYPKVLKSEIESETNTKKIDSIEDSIKEVDKKFQEDQKRQDEKISTNSGDIKAVKDSFSLYIELNKKNLSNSKE